jgi:hypothetical protein
MRPLHKHLSHRNITFLHKVALQYLLRCNLRNIRWNHRQLRKDRGIIRCEILELRHMKDIVDLALC